MKFVFKILGIVSLWSLVVGIIIMVDPVLLRDVVIPGVYLPFVACVFVAMWYSGIVLFNKIGLPLIIATLMSLAIVLSILQLMYWFVGLGIILVFVVVCYMHFSQLK